MYVRYVRQISRICSLFIYQKRSNMEIQGQAALVTGGGSGLGAATARELARLGAKVAVLDINAAGAEAVAKEIGGVAVTADITDSASVEAALDAAEQAHGPARILANIAGIGGA
jgi:NAD(P)-dependent dehydrogenase (short-subunit alcohol dehydrogenase family)